MSSQALTAVDLAPRFAKLFSGYQHAHGRTLLTDEVNERGKHVARSSTLELTSKQIADPETWRRLWRDHLNGTAGLGIVPLRSDSTAQFGVIDIDEYDGFDLADLAKRAGEHGLTACRSKSGGAHLYVFLTEPVPAANLRKALQKDASILGLPANVEIFPKSDGREPGDVSSGGWINVPYFNADSTERYALRADGSRMTASEFLDHAESVRLSPPNDAPELTAPKPKKDYQLGAVEGNRFNYIKSALGKHLQTYPDKTADQLIRYAEYERDHVMEPPVSGSDWQSWNIPKLCRKLISKQERQQQRGDKPASREELGLDVAEDIRENFILARDALDQIHFYDETLGRYVFDDHEQFARILRDSFRNNKKPYQISEADEKKLQRDLALDTPKFWEDPPLDRINVKNGILNVKTLTLEPHSPDFLYPNQFDIKFDPEATCPNTDKFISSVLGEAEQTIFYEIIGYCLMPDVDLQKAFLLQGTGSNGKSIALDLIQRILGKNNFSAVPIHKLESNTFAGSALVGKLANIEADMSNKRLPAASFFKAVTGGGDVDVEKKFHDARKVRLYSRMLISCNRFPRSMDDTPGFFRRWIVLPFSKKNFEHEHASERIQPSALLAMLTAEASGILNKAIQAYRDLKERGEFFETPLTKDALSEFKSLTDSIAAWLDENTIIGTDLKVAQKQLRAAYNAFCESKDLAPIGEKEFSSKVLQYRTGVTVEAGAHNMYYFVGIGAKADANGAPF